MEKIFKGLLIFIFILTLSACTKNNPTSDSLKITTTIFPYYSISKEICSEDADINMLIKPGTESHNYEPSTNDILTIQKSDIFIYTGGESDKWVDTILSSLDTQKTKIIKMTDYIEPIINEHNGHQVIDEHVWTSPQNANIIAKELCNTLILIDSEKSNIYKNNAKTFTNKINYLDTEFKNAIKNYDKTLIFADRFPFSYFARDYNLNYISAFPSCSEESEPSIQDMKKIVDTIKNEKITTIFYIEFSNKKVADAITSETNVNAMLFHSCHNVTQEEFDSGVSYISLMEQNLNNLKETVK